MWGRSRPPRCADMVVTSREVLDDELHVLRVIRWNDGSWQYTSGFEGDHSEPIATHFAHVLDVDLSLLNFRMRPGHFALRASPAADWFVWGPLSDEAIDDLITSGRIADMHNE